MEDMPLSAGSPAFASITASHDATIVQMLRAEGAILLGKTNMPPCAIGGGQPGVYGRTRSPFNPDYLASAWHSGSSVGSAVSVAAGYCDFGIGQETVSSGRSPASNNSVVAYTPSWGVVSSVGNLPLHPYRDVVVPHTTDISSLLSILRVIARKDDRDVWYRQSSVGMDGATQVIEALREGKIEHVGQPMRLGVPSLYVGESSSRVKAVPIRRSVRRLWEQTESRLLAAGVQLVRVPFPIVEAYEARSRAHDFAAEGYVPEGWTEFELGPLMTSAWKEFLREFGDGTLLADLSPDSIRPVPPWSTDLKRHGTFHSGRDSFDFGTILRSPAPSESEVLARAEAAVLGLNNARRILHDEWLDAQALDGLIFPANGDVGPWDADRNSSAAEFAWKDGCVFSNGNHVFRRVGIPSVTVPMGVLDDIGMPVGLTVVGRGWDDARLISIAAELERILPDRAVPRLSSDEADPLSFHDPLLPSSAPRLVQISAVASYNAVKGAGCVEVRNDDSQSISVELLGKTFRLKPGESLAVDAEPDEWREIINPLVVYVSTSEREDAAGFSELELGFSGEPNHVPLEGQN